MCSHTSDFCFFFFNDTATTAIYTLSLHDALPILGGRMGGDQVTVKNLRVAKVDAENNLLYIRGAVPGGKDRKSTRLNSSHTVISYAVFCLKKKKKNKEKQQPQKSASKHNKENAAA